MPFMIAGIFDGLTPCGAATVILFVGFMLLGCRTYCEMKLWAGGFTLGMMVGLVTLSIGAYEGVRALGGFDIVTNALYLFLALLSLVIGVVNGIDWWRIRIARVERRVILPLRFLKGNNAKVSDGCSPVHAARFVLLAAVSGWMLAVASSSCIGQLYMPSMIDMLMLEGRWGTAIFYLISYNIMYAFPLLVSACAIIGVARFPKGLTWIGRAMPRIKIVLSGLFFGIGFGFFYILF